ncbi:MAG: hypothetical protein HQL45_07430 [Alphaproteobacteria bacterium]|nr:hypothetical protein [Alphaproteobacteria bacterium]MBF0354013.1 hypothetical protein [Alphaproteobacteria bacterium]
MKSYVITVIVLIALAVFLTISAGQLSDRYESPPPPGFTRDVPKNLDGLWGEHGDCSSKATRTLDFLDGGFRWKKGGTGRDNYGLVRGVYKYDLGAARVLFKLNETAEGVDPKRGPEYEINIMGDTMVRRHVFEGFTEVYQRCREQPVRKDVPQY